MKPIRSAAMGKTTVMIALLLTLATPCQAAIYHTLKRGENLAIVARHYYGDPAKAIFLIEYNGIRDPRAINPGRRIVIPAVKMHRVRRGDTLALIAKRYLNDTEKSRGLAEINRIKDPKSLSPGTTLIIPVEILHTVKKGESLSGIAKKYYGDTSASRLIAQYNNIRDPRNMDPGTRLILPISDLRIVRKRDRPQPPAEPKPVPSTSKGEAFLEKGVTGYFTGDYLGAVENLQKAIALGLRGNENISRAHRFLAYAYVALNERNKAKDAFRKALEVDPEMKLDPVYVSPKIIEVFQEIR